jgi:hypothetical protein
MSRYHALVFVPGDGVRLIWRAGEIVERLAELGVEANLTTGRLAFAKVRAADGRD